MEGRLKFLWRGSSSLFGTMIQVKALLRIMIQRGLMNKDEFVNEVQQIRKEMVDRPKKI